MQSFRTSSDRRLLMLFIVCVGATLLLILGPVLHAIQLSLYEATSFVSARKWVGLSNYARIIVDPAFWHSLTVGLVFSVSAIVLQVLLGIAFALLLDQSFPGRALMRGIAILPYMLPTVVIAITAQWLLDGSLGLVTHWAQDLGFARPAWFENGPAALSVVITASVWTWTPFVTVCFLAALQTVPGSLYEAARVDGAGPIARFFHITLPMLVPMLMVVVLLRSIWMFNKFDIVWLLTKGGPLSATEHLPILAYRRAFMQFDVGGGATVATLSFLLLSILLAIYFHFVPLDDKEARS
ncbi:carbohydrate ABC transporter permease [Schauerella aestuarii]|uniref:carbohydrate ABC transporter permease n=1 Tax=Schauerella aestuarii TaxID=2511204 RepID=UPI001F36E7C6|nr:sugar ABC transporter permease [Achromobacter aestuarii]